MSDWKRNRVNVLRAERRWTQAKLARLMGLHPSTISLWEHARMEPCEKDKAKLARKFGVSEDQLLTPEQQAIAS